MILRRSVMILGLVMLAWLLLPWPLPAAPSAPQTSSAIRPRGANTAPGSKLDAAASPALSAIEQLSLSDRLARWAEREGDVVALIQAAKIRKALPAAVGNSGPRAADVLLRRAESMAGDNALLLGLINDARRIHSRGIPVLATGLGLLQRLIKPQAAAREELSFKGGEPAVVYLRADSPVDLDLYVYDEYNNLICADEGSGQEAQCRWRPRWTGSFLVDVRNHNETEVSYVFAVNSVAAVPGRTAGANKP